MQAKIDLKIVYMLLNIYTCINKYRVKRGISDPTTIKKHKNSQILRKWGYLQNERILKKNIYELTRFKL